MQILLIVYRYWDNKIRVCRYYQKRVGTQLRDLKKKEKGLGGRCYLTDTTIDRLYNYESVTSYSSKCWEPAKCEINFLVSLFHVTSNEDSIYHYPHCPIGLEYKYNSQFGVCDGVAHCNIRVKASVLIYEKLNFVFVV